MAASDPLLYFDLGDVEHLAGRDGGVHTHASCQHQLQGGKPATGGPATCTNVLDFLLCYGSYEHILDQILGLVDGPGLQSVQFSCVPWARLVARWDSSREAYVVTTLARYMMSGGRAGGLRTHWREFVPVQQEIR